MRYWICIALATVLGCQAAPPGGPLPRYSNLDGDGVQAILSRRAGMIHTMTGQCELTLTRRDGQAVRLDGLMVMAPPDRVRLRVWKLDHVVFDLTALPGGLWIETAPEATGGAAGGPIVPATVSAGTMSRQLSWLIGGFFASPGLRREVLPDGDLLYHRDGDGDGDGGTSIACEVDPATATARKFILRDSGGKIRFSLEISNYRDVAGIVWPLHLTARNAGDLSEIDVVFSDVEFNGVLAPKAFVPPPGAKKQP